MGSKSPPAWNIYLHNPVSEKLQTKILHLGPVQEVMKVVKSEVLEARGVDGHLNAWLMLCVQQLQLTTNKLTNY